MSRFETLRADATVLRGLLRGMPRAASHAEALGAFYAPQSADYDRFRERLLAGRAELIASLGLPDAARIVELGGGTGRNAEFFGPALARIQSIEIVDLCAPLLARACERARRIPQLRAIEADATTYRPAQAVDCVLLSYALTMIPDWRGALANAMAMLKPGGCLAVVDFYISARNPGATAARHGAIARRFWPAWFGHDGVRLDARHLPTLRTLMPRSTVVESTAAVPYLPLVRVPFYRFVGFRD